MENNGRMDWRDWFILTVFMVVSGIVHFAIGANFSRVIPPVVVDHHHGGDAVCGQDCCDCSDPDSRVMLELAHAKRERHAIMRRLGVNVGDIGDVGDGPVGAEPPKP